MKTTTKKTTAKKNTVKSAATRKTTAKKNHLPATSHSISCDDITWKKIQDLAEKADLNVSKYIIKKVLK